MKRWLLTLLSISSCFQAIPFPGQQAEVDVEAINGVDGATIDEGFFAELNIQQIDQNGDGTNDFGLSTIFTLSANFDVDTLCANTINSANLNDLVDSFDDAFLAGTIAARVEPLNQANGFRNGDRIVGDPAVGQEIVVSFFIAKQNGDVVAFADSAGEGTLNIDVINGQLDATSFDNLDLDFSQNQAGDPINSDIDVTLFKAVSCDAETVITDILINGLGVNL